MNEDDKRALYKELVKQIEHHDREKKRLLKEMRKYKLWAWWDKKQQAKIES
jgi:hypothetical protein